MAANGVLQEPHEAGLLPVACPSMAESLSVVLQCGLPTLAMIQATGNDIRVLIVLLTSSLEKDSILHCSFVLRNSRKFFFCKFIVKMMDGQNKPEGKRKRNAPRCLPLGPPAIVAIQSRLWRVMLQVRHLHVAHTPPSPLSKIRCTEEISAKHSLLWEMAFPSKNCFA